MNLFLAFQRDNAPANTNKVWTNVQYQANNTVGLDDAGSDSSVRITAALVDTRLNDVGGATGIGSGDAAWVDEQNIVIGGHANNSSDQSYWSSYTLSSVPSGVYDLEVFCNQPGGRITAVRVNGGTPQNSTAGNNLTATVKFTDIEPVSGEILIEYQRTAESTGASYVNAAWLRTQGPELSPNQSSLYPGLTVTGTGTNYTDIPADQSNATVSVTVDGVTTSGTVPVTITNANAGAGTFDFSLTIPDRPATDGQGVQRWPYGPMTINIPDPGA